MVATIKSLYGLNSPEVLSVLEKVPRHRFLPKRKWNEAYNDGPVSIGYSQTMSQPYTVAYMTHLLVDRVEEQESLSRIDLTRRRLARLKSKVLEIGTGSGYQAAVLSYFFGKVYTIEIIHQLADRARKSLKSLGYKNIEAKQGSGEWGWEENGPYDAIMITAGIEEVPKELLDQLRVGGVLVAPVGGGKNKVMTKFTKIKKRGKEELKKAEFGMFSFVPFVEEKN